jgi:L-galactose dehydrogenase
VDYVRLGKSGLISSVIGLGGGSSGRFGLAKGGTRSDALKLIRAALDEGITFFDGAGLTGGVDELLAEGLAGSREHVVLSTKVHLGPEPWPFDNARLPNLGSSWVARRFGLVCSGRTLRSRVEHTLRALKSDRIDILHLHAVSPRQYPLAVARVLPTLQRLKEQGMIRAIGITESFLRDPSHKMLRAAVDDASVDTIMVGLNFRNRSAADVIFPAASAAGIGVIGMFAARRLGKSGALDDIAAEAGAAGVQELAYRYCRHQAGMDVVLTGTGNPEHLRRNVEAALLPPLPDSVLRRLEAASDLPLKQKHRHGSDRH